MNHLSDEWKTHIRSDNRKYNTSNNSSNIDDWKKNIMRFVPNPFCQCILMQTYFISFSFYDIKLFKRNQVCKEIKAVHYA